jgi:hypothetical protein
LRYQRRSDVPKTLCDEHEQAVAKIVAILKEEGYNTITEWLTDPLEHKDQQIRFPIDIYAKSQILRDAILVQVDGEIHRHSDIQRGRTAQRDDTLKSYADQNGYRLILFNWVNCESDILHEYSNAELREKLGIG